MWQAYYNVSSIDEALTLLAEHGSAARIVAGGTDLIIEMERGQHPQLQSIIDITRVPGVDGIALHNGEIMLGPLVTHNHVVGSQVIRDYALPLAQASWEVGAPQIRNRATIAGNLITASPANDAITPLIAMQAEVTLESTRGSRRIKLADFYSGFRQTTLAEDELLRAIHIPALGEDERGVFLKLGLRRAQAISVVDAAVVIKRRSDGVIADAKIALGSVAATIIRAPGAEDYLRDKTLTASVISQAARIAGASTEPIDDVRGSAEYRSEMVKALVARALRQLAADEIESGLPERPPMLWGENGGIVTEGLAAQTMHRPDSPIVSRVNGDEVRIDTGQGKSLLHWLREDVGLPGVKEGCAEGECGACTVFLDGAAVMACMVHAPRAHHADIVTIEGLQTGEELHEIQQAFIDEAAVQCGYCTPGFLMAGAKLLDEIPQPDDEQINFSISGNLCRCTGYYKIVEAFRQASARKLQTERG